MPSVPSFTSRPDDPWAAAPPWAVIGQSAQTRDVRWQVKKAAATQSGVIITGEAGTGRGLVARAIHASNGTPKTLFVPVYCEQRDAGSLERELFGSEGSSAEGTSARSGARRKPKIEHVAAGSLLHHALGGTIYFRHIEELPDRMQARLSQLFRDGEAVIDGATGAGREPQAFAARPMLAADTGFQAFVAEGRVRQDLYRRFANVCIDLPPLRERRDDIPALAAYFVARACSDAGEPAKVLSDAALTVLCALPWTGNVRELRAVVNALVANVETTEIGTADVMAQLNVGYLVGRPLSVPEPRETLSAARERFERDYIAAVLDRCHGRIPDAAKALGIQRTNLYRKLRTLHVPRRERATT